MRIKKRVREFSEVISLNYKDSILGLFSECTLLNNSQIDMDEITQEYPVSRTVYEFICANGSCLTIWGLLDMPALLWECLPIQKVQNVTIQYVPLEQIPYIDYSTLGLSSLKINHTTLHTIQGVFSNIQQVNLSNNHLEYFGSTIFRNIEHVDLHSNSIRQIPKDVLFDNVKLLDLSNNPIEVLPDTIYYNNSIQFLSLEQTNIRHLDLKSILKYSKLTIVRLPLQFSLNSIIWNEISTQSVNQSHSSILQLQYAESGCQYLDTEWLTKEVCSEIDMRVQELETMGFTLDDMKNGISKYSHVSYPIIVTIGWKSILEELRGSAIGKNTQKIIQQQRKKALEYSTQ